jgi:hypothetical protein
MTKQEFIKRCGSELVKLLDELPSPLLEPIWYPGVARELENRAEVLAKIERFLRNLAGKVVKVAVEEGIYDENPLIRIYPNYPEASGIVVFHKGRRVFEKWISSFELNWGDKQQVVNRTADWYEEMRYGMDPDEYERYLDQIGEGR